MSDADAKQPGSSAERLSEVDLGWSDVPPPTTTGELAQAPPAKLPETDAPAHEEPRELPRYEAPDEHAEGSGDADTDDFQELLHEDATKRIAYAALLGGAQAGRGGPRPSTPPSEVGLDEPDDDEVHEQPTLVGRPALTEEAARKLAGEEPGLWAAGAPGSTGVGPAEPPLPAFDREPGFDAFEPAAFEPAADRQPQPDVDASESAPFGATAEQTADVPGRSRLPSDPLPRLGFDDSDLTVRAVVKMPPEMFPDREGIPAKPIVEEIGPRPAAGRRPSAPPPPARPTAASPVARGGLEQAAASAFAAARLEGDSASPDEVVLKAPVAPNASHRPVPVAARASESPLPAATTHSVAHAHSAAPAYGAANAHSAAGLLTPEPPGLFGALGQRFRFLRMQLPIWPLWLIPTALAGFAVVMSLIKGQPNAPNATLVVPSPASTALAASSPSANPAGLSLRERAVRGDPGAVRDLSHRPETERSVADAVALAKGKTLLEARELALLVQKLQRAPSTLDDEATRNKLLEYVMDPRTAPDALAAISELPGPEGPDLLYEVWTGTKKTTDTTQLARELLHKQEVLGKASESLKVAVDLRADPTCDEALAILPRAEASGDWRSLHLLGRLLSRRGCGDDERRDCFKCLRSDKGERAISDAIKAVRSRPRPKL